MGHLLRASGRLVSALLLTLSMTQAQGSDDTNRLYFAGSGTAVLNIQGVVETAIFRPVLDAFHHHHPDITLTYQDVSETEMQWPPHSTPPADLLMSSAMAQQYRLANGGYAQSLGPDTINAQWPASARWRDELVGLTREPLVMVYRRELADIAPPPQDHAALLTLVTTHRQALTGRITGYDPTRSATGFMVMAQDVARSQEAWALFDAMGKADARLLGTTAEMLEGLISGRYLIGYNLIGSYARRVVAEHPELTLQVPKDYALALQRLAMIPADAPHPQTAKRFLSFITSGTGQQVMTQHTTLGSPLQTLNQDAATHFEPIALTPGLLALIDPLKREALLDHWQTIFGEHSAVPGAPLKAVTDSAGTTHFKANRPEAE